MPPRRRPPRTNDAGPGAPSPGPPSYVKLKTECRFYKLGTCRKGEQCSFRHMAAIHAPASSNAAPLNNTVDDDHELDQINAEPLSAVTGPHVVRTPLSLNSQRGDSAPHTKESARTNVIDPDANRADQPAADVESRVGLPQVEAMGVAPGNEHPQSTSRNRNRGHLSQTHPFPRHNSRKPCFAICRLGRCNKGEQCTYSHNPEILEQYARAQAAEKAVEAARRASTQREEALREGRAIREEAERKERAQREEQDRLERERRDEAERILREQREADQRRRDSERFERERIAREAAQARERQIAEQRERQRREREERQARERERLLHEQEERRRRESEVTLQLLVKDSNLVTFGAGLDVKQLIPGFELCKITISELPLDATDQEISNIFREQGLDDTMFKPLRKLRNGATWTAEFLMRVGDAKLLEVGLEGLEFRDSELMFKVGANASWGSMKSSNQDENILTVLWNQPQATMIATYDTLEEARVKARQLNGRRFKQRRISAIMNTRPNGPAGRFWHEASIKLSNLAPDTTTDEIVKLSGAILVREIKSNVYNLAAFLGQLQMDMGSYTAGSFRTTTINESRMKAIAQYASRRDLEEAARSLQTIATPRLQVIVPDEHQYTITIPARQYRAQKAQWDSLSEGARGGKAFVRINERRNTQQVLVNVQGSEEKDVGCLKVRVESLVAGERLDAEHWHGTFSNHVASRAFFETLTRETSTFPTVDVRFQALRVFGPSEAIMAAKELIRAEVHRLALMEWDIPIARRDVRFLVAAGLQVLKDALGEENVTLDVASRQCRIKLRGSDDDMQRARKLIEQSIAAANLGVRPTLGEAASDTPPCPICYDTPTHPEVLSCGHSCCEACLRHYLSSAVTSNNFPLVCMGNEAQCNTPISIPVIQRYMISQRFDQLVDAVFDSHIQTNVRRFKYCTTADCIQIYQCDTDQQFHQCPSCFAKICSSCNEEAHEGMTCEERRVQGDPAEQERLNEEWALGNHAKRCPGCSALTQKTEGCNHMTCALCKEHWCWICRAGFGTATHFGIHPIYDHLSTAHGGWHGDDGEAPRPVVRPVPAPIPPHRPVGLAPAQLPAGVRPNLEPGRRVLGVQPGVRPPNLGEPERFQLAQDRFEGALRFAEAYRQQQRELDARLIEATRRQQEQRRRAEEIARQDAQRREAERRNEGWGCAIM